MAAAQRQATRNSFYKKMGNMAKWLRIYLLPYLHMYRIPDHRVAASPSKHRTRKMPIANFDQRKCSISKIYKF